MYADFGAAPDPIFDFAPPNAKGFFQFEVGRNISSPPLGLDAEVGDVGLRGATPPPPREGEIGEKAEDEEEEDEKPEDDMLPRPLAILPIPEPCRTPPSEDGGIVRVGGYTIPLLGGDELFHI